jgi:hypothetical protein
MSVKKALTLVGGDYRYLRREDALVKGGRCYFCGCLLRDHPRATDGSIPLNRHHRGKCVFEFEGVYTAVTGHSYPSPNQNMFWVGIGCHLEFHTRIDPWPLHAPYIPPQESRDEWPAEVIRQIAAKLRELLWKFLRKMYKCNFGERCLNQPAPLPNWKSFPASA